MSGSGNLRCLIFFIYYGLSFGFEDNTLNSNSAYEFVYSPKATWMNASMTCINKYGGQLAILDTEEKNAAIISHLKDSLEETQESRWWIGSKVDPGSNRKFVWVNGNEVTYSNWAEGEPNNCCEKPQNCVMLHDNLGYKWNDWKCERLLSYICEKS